MFEKLGVAIEPFGNKSFRITSVPKIFAEHDMKELIHEVIEDLNNPKLKTKADDMSLKTISYLACRTAIKAGDYLTHDERKNLLEKLANTKTKYTCPHGRPVRLNISFNELAKMFKRS